MLINLLFTLLIALFSPSTEPVTNMSFLFSIGNVDLTGLLDSVHVDLIIVGLQSRLQSEAIKHFLISKLAYGRLIYSLSLQSSMKIQIKKESLNV